MERTYGLLIRILSEKMKILLMKYWGYKQLCNNSVTVQGLTGLEKADGVDW